MRLILENVKDAKKLLNTLKIDPDTNPSFLKIRKMLSGNDGYTYWFCKQHFVNKCSLDTLEEIINDIKGNKDVISLFKTPVTELETIEDFQDAWNRAIYYKTARKAYNLFLAAQKKLIKFEYDYDLLYQLGSIKDATQYFYNKSKRYKTRDDLISAIITFVNAKNYIGYDDLLLALKKSSNVNIVHESKDNDIIVVNTNHAGIVEFASDTSWCIRNEETFDSYMRHPLSQQFIIFLTDFFDNKSKIGVTTNIRGYYTAHLKNDSSFPNEKLIELFSDREVDYKIILPSKEAIQKLNNYNNISLNDLISIGFTIEEIMVKKNRFNDNDFLHFSKEDIIKYRFLFISPFSIINAKKFTYDEILSLIKKDRKNYDPNTPDGRLLNMLKKRSSKSIVDNLESLAYRIDSSWDRRDYIKGTLMNFLGDKVSYDNYISNYKCVAIHSANIYDHYKNITKTYDIPEKSLGRTIDEILSSIGADPRILTFFNNLVPPSIDDEKFIDFLIKGYEIYVKRHSNWELITKNVKYVNKPRNTEGLNIYNHFYSLLVQECRSNFGRWDVGKIVEVNGFGYLESVLGDLEIDINNIDLKELFDSNVPIKDMYSFIEFLKKYNLLTYDESGYKFLEECLDYKHSNNNIIKLRILCIKNNIDVENSFEFLDSYFDKNTDSDSGVIWHTQGSGIQSMINDIIKKEDVYLDRWLKYSKKIEINNQFARTSKIIRNDKTDEYEKWYEFFEPFKDKNLHEIGFSDKVYNIFIILTKLRKLEEWSGFIFSIGLINDRATFEVIKKISILICDRNNDSSSFYVDLSKEDRKYMYDFLIKKIPDIVNMYNSDDVYTIHSAIAPSMYLFDKRKFWRYVDWVKGVKNNYNRWRETPITYRFALLKSSVYYMAQEDKLDDVKKVLDILSSLKMNKSEIEMTKTDLNWFNYGSRLKSNSKPKPSIQREEDIEKKYKELISGYFNYVPKKRVKKQNESYIITRFDKFF